MRSPWLVERAETGYDKAQRALMQLRTNGVLPWGAIDNYTRWVRKERSYDGMDELLESAAAGYRKAVWTGLNQRIEFWIEKDALSGVFVPITNYYDVPLYPARGYSSATFIQREGAEIAADHEYGIATYIYHMGDYDPSGQDAARAIKKRLAEFTPEDSFHFEQLAVLPWQISD